MTRPITARVDIAELTAEFTAELVKAGVDKPAHLASGLVSHVSLREVDGGQRVAWIYDSPTRGSVDRLGTIHRIAWDVNAGRFVALVEPDDGSEYEQHAMHTLRPVRGGE